MVSPETFNAIIAAAIAAPSPDNNQPWLFRTEGDSLLVYLDHSRSLPSDVKSMFDMTSIGAAIENAVIAAAELGYQAEVLWRGDDVATMGENVLQAEIRLTQGASPDPLYSALTSRCTNRKMYSSSPLDGQILDSLTKACHAFGDVQIDWLTTKTEKAVFGKLIASTDALRFQHQPFHEELFRQLRFTPQEAESTADGLDVRTLELPPGLAQALPLLRNWSVMRTLISLKMLPLLTMPSVISVKKSGAIGIVSVPAAAVHSDCPAKIFLTGGRAIERLWLAADKAGLSVHPLGSLSIFLLQEDVKPAFEKSIEQARRGVLELLPGLKGRVIQLALRFGISKPPSERSIRRPLADVRG